MSDALLEVEVAYAEPQRVIVKRFQFAPGAVAADALRLAALDPDFAGVHVSNSPFGIFGTVVRSDVALQDGDRIEIYRPLEADPKAARRARASQSRR